MHFTTLPRAFPRQVLESCPDSCFAVSESLDITYCNKAWDRFAEQNQGAPEFFAARVVSRNLLDFIPEDIRKYHADLFKKARARGQPVSHDYECSSANVFRLYRMQIYPLESGFVIINARRVEHGHDRTSMEPNEALYRNSAGVIRMCANCGRTNRAEDRAAWDWVPAYVEHKPEKTTHGVCPPCLEYYYRPYMAPLSD
jgi:hypothetical protein